MSFYSFYSEKIFPVLNDVATSSFSNHKREAISGLSGEVLEIGFGSGRSLDLYPQKVKKLVGLEPSEGMLKRAQKLLPGNLRFQAEVVQGSAEKLPFKEDSFDYVVSFLVLCTVSDPEQSIAEIKRVLRPTGKLVFIEHQANTKGSFTRRLQDFIWPAWKKFACGCTLNRETIRSLEESGFEIQKVETLGHDGFPNFASPFKKGIARIKTKELAN